MFVSESVGFSKLIPPWYLRTQLFSISSTINPEESSPDTPTFKLLFSGSDTVNTANSSVFSSWEYDESKSLILGGLFTSETDIVISSLSVV